MNLLRNKRGVSPLIATILLIAFAVALGAVVMNVGRSTIGAMDAGFSILELGGKKQVCFFDRAENSALELTIKNGDIMELEDLQVSVIGIADIVNRDHLLQVPIKKAEIKKVMVLYDARQTGKLRKIVITPNIIRNGERTLGTGLELEGLQPC
jgi:flagellin-like protein